MKLSVVIPCYNELENVQKLEKEFFPVIEGLIESRLVDDLPVNEVEIVFVDDGSRDGTYDVLRSAFEARSRQELQLKFEKHNINRGLGAAIRTGLRATTGDIIVTTDSDGTYQFTTIPELLACMKKGVDVITASPYHPKGQVVGVPAYRIFLSRGSSLIYRILLDWSVHTYTALFRAYRRTVIDSVDFKADDYLGGTELMVKAMLNGCRIAEYPATLHRRVFGISKARLMQTIISHLRFQFALLLHKLRIAPLA